MESADTGFSERPAMERRLVLRVLNWWRALKGDRRWPSAAKVIESSRPELWPYSFLLQLGRWRDDPLFRHCGDAFTQPPGAMLTLSNVSALPPRTLIASALEFHHEVIEREVPITRGGSFEHAAGNTVKFRAIILPLGDKDDMVTHLLGAANSVLLGDEQ